MYRLRWYYVISCDNIFVFYVIGLITRLEAESLLLDQPDGTFLVRLSERIWGYAISYKASDKCKHYLVNAGTNYRFLGKNQIEHNTLGKYMSTFHFFLLIHACFFNDNGSIVI